MSDIWAPAPPLPTPLGRYRVLSPLAGWGKFGMGEMDKEASFKLLDAFYDAGGNFIDTSNNYQDETSEAFIGEWAEERGIRDQLVIATKVLYLGISDSPAWVVASANRYATDHGKTPFMIYQGAWNVLERSFERDIIPMACTLGLALAPWNKGRTLLDTDWMRNDNEKKMCAALEKVAKEVGAGHITAVAIAYLMQKTPYVFPIIGGRKVEHLVGNIEALKISLSDEQIENIESIIPFDPGFPNTFVMSKLFDI
ncbi:hypothetical protein M0805_008518 [Coniferiporia weirii]|nr:hypothetical protein M0805_008518 [Coniferiporia weirii]